MALFPKLFLYFLQGGGENIFIKLRLIVIYLTVVLIGWLLPPDITYLIAALTATTVLLEGLYYVYLLLKEYNSLAPPPSYRREYNLFNERLVIYIYDFY